MTRRERLERKVERRQEWAGKAQVRSEQAFEAAHELQDRIPLGQPILVGHHSEAGARRDHARIDARLGRGIEQADLAEYHTGKVEGLTRQLDRSIFADDPDAVEALEARIAENEATADLYATINKAWRKNGGDLAALVASGVVSAKLAETISRTMARAPWLDKPLDATNLRARIRADRERLERIQTDRAESALAAWEARLPGGCPTDCEHKPCRAREPGECRLDAPTNK